MISTGPNLELLCDAERGEEHYLYLAKLLRGLDGLVQAVAMAMDVTAPSGTEEDGDVVLVAASGATGAFAGKENHVARRYTVGEGAPGWDFFPPQDGWSVRVASVPDASGAPSRCTFNDGAWRIQASSFDSIPTLLGEVMLTDSVVVQRSGTLHKVAVSDLPHPPHVTPVLAVQAQWVPPGKVVSAPDDEVMTNDNRTVKFATAGYGYGTAIRASDGRWTGKRYAEIKHEGWMYSNQGLSAGVITEVQREGLLDTDSSEVGNTHGISYRIDGRVYRYGSATTDLPTYNTGDVVGIAVDFTANKLWFSLNGTWLTYGGGVGNPETGEYPAATQLNKTGDPAVSVTNPLLLASSINYFSATATVRTVAEDFSYPIPEGFEEWGVPEPIGAHRYWGIRINSNNGQSFVMLARIEFASSPGGAKLNTNSADCTSTPWVGVFGNSRDYAWGSYDMEPNPGSGGLDRWMENASDMPFIQGYDFESAVSITEVRMRCLTATGQAAYGIKDFDVIFSDDGINWGTAATFLGQSWTDETDIKTYSIT